MIVGTTAVPIFIVFIQYTAFAMAFYIRKSLNLGPVRLNFSKSGIGTSIGVKGFRVGVKPNGKSYLHAGRGGLYYREEFGGNNNISASVISDERNKTYYNTASSEDVKSEYKANIVEELNRSYKAFRLDYLTGSIFLLFEIILFLFFSSNLDRFHCIILSLFGLIGIVSFLYVSKWEKNRRQIDLVYEFENNNFEHYEKIVSAINHLVKCNKIWGLVDSEYLSDPHQRKINAGTGYIVNRVNAVVGTDELPWVRTNITPPVISTCGRRLYFMPDGIIVYDSKGVAYVEYQDVMVSSSTTSFVENNPPQDAKIIYYTWQYANKDGGPDRRFANNKEIPVCSYGELTINVKEKQLLHIMTSVENAPWDFERIMKQI